MCSTFKRLRIDVYFECTQYINSIVNKCIAISLNNLKTNRIKYINDRYVLSVKCIKRDILWNDWFSNSYIAIIYYISNSYIFKV